MFALVGGQCETFPSRSRQTWKVNYVIEINFSGRAQGNDLEGDLTLVAALIDAEKYNINFMRDRFAFLHLTR